VSRQRFDELVEDSVGGPVTTGVMFGARGLRTGTRFFAVWWGDRLLVKLPSERIADLHVAGRATPFVPRGRRPMKNWAELSDDADWAAVCEEARGYVEAG